MISIEPLTIVFGTPVTRYLRDSSMNSVASTLVARMKGLSTAMRWASVTARGQCGQVGVTNTLMSRGSRACAAISALLSAVSPESSVPARMTASMSAMNS